MEKRKNQAEYVFLKQNTQYTIPKMRQPFIVYFAIFQIIFVVLFGIFCKYDDKPDPINDSIAKKITKSFPSKYTFNDLLLL